MVRNPKTRLGWDGLSYPPEKYNMYSDRPFHIPVDTRPVVIYLDGVATSIERARLETKYNAWKTYFQMYANIKTLLIVEFLRCFNKCYFETLQVGPLGYGGKSLL